MTFYSHRHTNGNGYIPTRSIYLCIVFDLQFLNFLRSRKPKTSVSKRILICSAPPSLLHRSVYSHKIDGYGVGRMRCKGTHFLRIMMQLLVKNQSFIYKIRCKMMSFRKKDVYLPQNCNDQNDNSKRFIRYFRKQDC